MTRLVDLRVTPGDGGDHGRTWGSIGVPCNHPLPGRFADASCAHRTAWFAVRARRGAGRVHRADVRHVHLAGDRSAGSHGIHRTVTGMWSAAGRRWMWWSTT